MYTRYVYDFKEQLLRTYESVENYLKFYTLGSLVCVAVDLIASLVLLILAGNSNLPCAFLAMLFVVTIYFYIDTWFIFWCVKLRFVVEDEFQMEMPKALLGFGQQFRQILSCVGGKNKLR
jgi:hypothetical protein